MKIVTLTLDDGCLSNTFMQCPFSLNPVDFTKLCRRGTLFVLAVTVMVTHILVTHVVPLSVQHDSSLHITSIRINNESVYTVAVDTTGCLSARTINQNNLSTSTSYADDNYEVSHPTLAMELIVLNGRLSMDHIHLSSCSVVKLLVFTNRKHILVNYNLNFYSQ